MFLQKPLTFKKRREFLKIAATKRVLVTPFFIVQYDSQPVEGDDQKSSPWHVGFTASRKVGGAVERNFAKRRLRELVRLYWKKQNPMVGEEMAGTSKMTATASMEVHTVFIARRRLLTEKFIMIQEAFEKSMHRALADLYEGKTHASGEGER